ncbi:LysR family transcriptional regulator [Cupriavidus basilensis]|uniref:LysR family transcriptional regulator n=1 Tax=Cupriavidus basilensis TaxID=68895 RepID=A0ABT6APA5_9BURK|nr:LysR family transcriptional regulator [Cupriavidus basilensis]MDF3834279.1 LysR family transcriptional regulator [Cupriavidus basilensis]
MDPFREIELFVHVADLGNISRAAEALDLSTSAASRLLVGLEARLGVKLIQRTTRRLYLTEIGEEFHRRCKSILSEMREAEEIASEAAVNPTGLLRVSASLSFCMLHIEPLLPEFTSRYPDITVDVVSANRYLDIIENGVDVAIRTRPFEVDSNITIRRLAETRRIFAASPRYLERYGTPTSPDDLKAHKMLIYTYALNPEELALKHGSSSVLVKVKPALSANDGQIVRRAAIDGMGILVQPKYIVYADLQAGTLVPILDDWELPRLTMNIAFQTRTHLPAKARLFIEALTERFRINDFERLWTS